MKFPPVMNGPVISDLAWSFMVPHTSSFQGISQGAGESLGKGCRLGRITTREGFSLHWGLWFTPCSHVGWLPTSEPGAGYGMGTPKWRSFPLGTEALTLTEYCRRCKLCFPVLWWGPGRWSGCFFSLMSRRPFTGGNFGVGQGRDDWWHWRKCLCLR